MSFAVRSIMKMMSAALVSLTLFASPAAAETKYQSMMSGNVKIEVTPQGAKGEAQPKAGDTLTIHFVAPPKKSADGDDDDPAKKLEQCGEKWNKKLADYEKRLTKLKTYVAYYDKWAKYPAQRPPKLGEPLLTRESYRACMYECLGDSTFACPGGWPSETKSESGAAEAGNAAAPAATARP
jgi:hypothetical protein